MRLLISAYSHIVKGLMLITVQILNEGVNEVGIEEMLFDLLVRLSLHIGSNLLEIEKINEMVKINRRTELVKLLIKRVGSELLRKIF